jgi:hypothetical protein
MLCTFVAVNSVFAAGADPLEPVPSPGIPGIVKPPPVGDGVGVEVLGDPPQPAIPRTAPTDAAATRSDLMVMGFPVVIRQRSLRAESPPDDIAAAMANRPTSPNRENAISLVQSKQ